RCGSVAALPGDELDTGAQCEPAPAGRASIIRYRPEVLLAALDRFDTVATYALAHEYGHHLDVTMNGAPSGGDLWVGELRADLIAGCALARAHAELTEVRLVLLEEMTPRDPELRQAQRRCGMDGIHPAPEWGYRAVEAGRALCTAGVPTLLELREAADPIARAARQSAAEAGTPWTGTAPCEPDIAGALRALERGVGAPP
ncbi:MAG: hypothetical protein IT373_10785, partial [Polyangiaceae bacterium]|nr:hypothetical protein [Polyangiaceae bacterium]